MIPDKIKSQRSESSCLKLLGGALEDGGGHAHDVESVVDVDGGAGDCLREGRQQEGRGGAHVRRSQHAAQRRVGHGVVDGVVDEGLLLPRTADGL